MAEDKELDFYISRLKESATSMRVNLVNILAKAGVDIKNTSNNILAVDVDEGVEIEALTPLNPKSLVVSEPLRQYSEADLDPKPMLDILSRDKDLTLLRLDHAQALEHTKSLEMKFDLITWLNIYPAIYYESPKTVIKFVNDAKSSLTGSGAIVLSIQEPEHDSLEKLREIKDGLDGMSINIFDFQEKGSGVVPMTPAGTRFLVIRPEN